MIVGTTKGSANIPKEAALVTKEEALNHQKKLVENWPSIMEVFFLRFGRDIATASTVLCSAACINVFHPLLKFGRGTITAVIPSIAIPAALIYCKTDNILTNEVLTMKINCPICYQLKFLAVALYGGIGFPGLMGLLNTNAGHGVTYVKTDTREYWRKTFNIAKRYTFVFQGIIFIQTTLALTLPFLQRREITKIMEQLTENPLEKDAEEIL